jgi:hypothetical protein
MKILIMQLPPSTFSLTLKLLLSLLDRNFLFSTFLPTLFDPLMLEIKYHTHAEQHINTSETSDVHFNIRYVSV